MGLNAPKGIKGDLKNEKKQRNIDNEKKVETHVFSGLGYSFFLIYIAGCKLGTTLDDLKEEYSLKAQVTYYANGGEFENKRTVKHV